MAMVGRCQAVSKHDHSEGVRDLWGMARDGRTWQRAHGQHAEKMQPRLRRVSREYAIHTAAPQPQVGELAHDGLRSLWRTWRPYELVVLSARLDVDDRQRLCRLAAPRREKLPDEPAVARAQPPLISGVTIH